MHENLIKLVDTLITDQNAAGWDGPSRVYEVTGSEHDPILELRVELDQHPVDILAHAHSLGYGLSSAGIGLVVTTEAWVALTYEEIMAQHPEVIEGIIEMGVACGFSEDELRESAPSGWQHVIENVPPRQMNDKMRKEIRTALVHLTSGDRLLFINIRGRDEIHHDEPMGLIADALKLFIEGNDPRIAMEVPALSIPRRQS